MADYAEKITDRPPPTLTLFWQCRRWGTLPETGGILDQPAWFDWIEDAGYVYECYLLKVRLRDTVKLLGEYPEAARLVIEVDRARGLI